MSLHENNDLIELQSLKIIQPWESSAPAMEGVKEPVWI